MKKLIFFLILSNSFFGNSLAGSVDPKVIAGGLAWSPNINRTVLPPTAEPKMIPKKESLSNRQKEIVAQAEALAKTTGNLSLLLVENGEIIFENYKHPSTQNTQLASWSMSKSLTAMLVGVKHCQGDIPDLDRSAESYAPSLKGTAQGKASVRDLLKMASGGKKTATYSGEHRMTAWREIVVARTLSIDQYLKEFGTPEKTFFGMSTKKDYDYNNLDTVSLEKVISSVSSLGFIEEFNREIWQRSKPENFGVWLKDKNGQAISYAGFNATARDWIRLALLSKDLLNDPDPCIRNFMKLATTDQIKTDRPAFTQYGYQTWVANWDGKSSYWWRGYAGQRIAVDSKKNLIMFVSSSNDDYKSQIYDLFKSWQKVD
jgi:hypothetical protein